MKKHISSIPFNGTAEQEAKLKAVIAERKHIEGCLMQIMQEAQEIYGYLPVEVLGIQPGECTPDGKFSLEACRCIGACGLAPVLTVNDEVYGRLTEKDIDGIIAKYKDL